MALIFIQAREWFVDSDAPGIAAVTDGWHLLVAASIVVGVCAVAAGYFMREARRAAEEL